jgi:hypothetical protein
MNAPTERRQLAALRTARDVMNVALAIVPDGERMEVERSRDTLGAMVSAKVDEVLCVVDLDALIAKLQVLRSDKPLADFETVVDLVRASQYK